MRPTVPMPASEATYLPARFPRVPEAESGSQWTRKRERVQDVQLLKRLIRKVLLDFDPFNCFSVFPINHATLS